MPAMPAAASKNSRRNPINHIDKFHDISCIYMAVAIQVSQAFIEIIHSITHDIINQGIHVIPIYLFIKIHVAINILFDVLEFVPSLRCLILFFSTCRYVQYTISESTPSKFTIIIA